MEGHAGILAAAMSWPDLLRQLSGLVGEFVEHEAVETRGLDENGNVTTCTAGEAGGKAYLAGASCRLSGCQDPDLIVELAVTSGRLVVGCCADPVVGHYHLVAADRDGLLRCYHHFPGRMAQPFEWGEPLPTEARYPLGSDHDGDGMKRALAFFGFAPEGCEVAERQDRRVLKLRSRPFLPAAQPGPLARALQAHYHWFQPGLEGSGSMAPDEDPKAVTWARRPVVRKLKYAVFPFRSLALPESGAARGRRRDQVGRPEPREDGGWWNRHGRRAAEGA